MTGPRAPSVVPLLLGPLALLALVVGLSAVARPARPPGPAPSPSRAPADDLGPALRAAAAGAPSVGAASTATPHGAPGPVASADGWEDDWVAESLGFLQGARVRGLVLDDQGRPAGEVVVELRADPAGESDWPEPGSGGPLGAVVAADELLGRGRTGPDGAFVLPLDGPVGPFCHCLSVTARAPDGALAVASASFLPPDAQGVHDLGELRLRRAHRLEVLAVGAGQPLAGTSVAVRVRGAGRSSHLLGTTDATGALAVDLLAEVAEVELVLRKAGRASARLELGALAGARSVQVDLAREALLWGRVVDARGRPVPGATITARPVQPGLADGGGAADVEGRFVIGGLADGAGYDVQAQAPLGACAPLDLEVALPSPELLLRLEVPGALLVTLVPPRSEAASRAWLSAVELELLRAGPSGAWRPAVWHEAESAGGSADRGDWGDDWGDDWTGAPAPPRPAARRLAADERLLLGLAPGRYWVRARDPWSQAASAPVELLVASGAEETVTLVLEAER